MSLIRNGTERDQDEEKYNIYCINFHGSGLKSIKNEYKRQVATGLRRNVYILDLDEIQHMLEIDASKSTKLLRLYQENPSNHLINAIEKSIHDMRKEYESTTKKINDELKFDLFIYWQKDLEKKAKKNRGDTASLRSGKTVTGTAKTKKNTSRGDGFYTKGSLLFSGDDEKCEKLVRQEHSRVGQQEMLSKRKYIRDDPPGEKLYFIIVGSMNESFFLELLRREMPIQGMIHFVPIENKYDILLNNPELRNFIENTYQSISDSIVKLRQEVIVKPIGLFTYPLPVISECMATKYQKDIFDQLTWSVYDIEMLYQQYYDYYFGPFQITNVDMPLTVDLLQLYEFAASISLQGHFQRQELSGNSTEVNTILAYLDCLLTTIALPEKIINQRDVILLAAADSPQSRGSALIKELVRTNKSAFSSITKIRKFGRLFVEEGNATLVNVLQYANQLRFKDLYLACLDCSQWRAYATSLKPRNVAQTKSARASLSLPGFTQFYANDDSCKQRLLQLCDSYIDKDVMELKPGYKLYTFRRKYNFTYEENTLSVIPTRLCFRDFSLFQKEEFLENLTMPSEQSSFVYIGRGPSITKLSYRRKSKLVEPEDETIYIRPKSLKALKVSKVEREMELTQTQREREHRSSRMSTHNGKRQSARVSQESTGLPQDHPLLRGYNLDDTRQEIRTKTVSYFFHDGKIKLYEDKWCFQDMNQTMTFEILNCKLYLNRPKSKTSGIVKGLRLETQSNIGIRILNEPQECAKVVLNYPNGLSVYYHDIHCEQVWWGDETFNKERRRINTPYGATIVYYQNDDMILITRYNGEVYRLYQYDVVEEQEEESMLSEFTNVGSSEILENQPPGDGPEKRPSKERQSFEHKQSEGDNNNENKPQKGKRKGNRKSKRMTIPDNDEITLISLANKTGYKEKLKYLIEFELMFLCHITATYNIRYVRLEVTTSAGRCFTIRMDGQINERARCQCEERHDYFANEILALRNDGVKMVWSQDTLKCYHKDGTLFTTNLEEGLEFADDEELDNLISRSSSHEMEMEMEEEEQDQDQELSKISVVKPELTPSMLALVCKKRQTMYEQYLSDLKGEEPEDIRYVRYSCLSWLVQHQRYAGAYFLWTRSTCSPKVSVHMEVLAVDNIVVYTSQESGDDIHLYSDSSVEGTTEGVDEGEEEGGEPEIIRKVLVNVCLGEVLHFTVEQKCLEITAMVGCPKAEAENKSMSTASDLLTLKILFKDSLKDVFTYMRKEIAAIYRYDGPIENATLFLDLNETDCNRKGFEFIEKLPETAQYQHQRGNSVIMANPLKNKTELMLHPIACHEKDMKKFSVFRREVPNANEEELPMVLTTNTYNIIPPTLRNTDKICSFVESFSEINFKHTRRYFKQFLDKKLRPAIDLKYRILYSTNNWAKRHKEHERRKFREIQRLGLYHAMLKHKKYPSYCKFMGDYKGHVSEIDFFEFMQTKCKNIEVPRQEVYWKPKLWQQKTPINLKKKSKHDYCLYGTYD